MSGVSAEILARRLPLARRLCQMQDRPGPCESDPPRRAHWSELEFSLELSADECRLYLWPLELDPLGSKDFLGPMENIQGYVFYRRTADELWIMNLVVQEKSQRRGADLLKSFEAFARRFEPAVKSWGLEVAVPNVQARRLYQKFGFVEVGYRKSYYRSGEDALVLRRFYAPSPAASD